ncbi:hypothetical protein Pcinc_030665 [Petrolisthes cinctipes]|uniref:Uncharacterized protein n=1 Tax=Petrolisthes cinctipes TaxID=88211 RepID=A0AAE1EYU3_PETCI|nr:hypothetical protein Pcinc_030665 [Petrolisthes cinctipes]
MGTVPHLTDFYHKEDPEQIKDCILAITSPAPIPFTCCPYVARLLEGAARVRTLHLWPLPNTPALAGYCTSGRNSCDQVANSAS